jgi:hypothetical protein
MEIDCPDAAVVVCINIHNRTAIQSLLLLIPRIHYSPVRFGHRAKGVIYIFNGVT